MNHDKDPEWEIVDKLPNEKSRKRPRATPRKTPLYKSSILWIGLGLGILLAAAFPPMAILIRKLLSLWWLALLIIGYQIYKRVR